MEWGGGGADKNRQGREVTEIGDKVESLNNKT